jgi:hypothetical protein
MIRLHLKISDVGVYMPQFSCNIHGAESSAVINLRPRFGTDNFALYQVLTQVYNINEYNQRA